MVSDVCLGTSSLIAYGSGSAVVQKGDSLYELSEQE